MEKNNTRTKNQNKVNKAQSLPNYFYANKNFGFLNKKSSLEILIHLIKINQVNFFSSSKEKNDVNIIIESLFSLKKSISNSLNNQSNERDHLLKEVK
jgi:hypothetical protein